MQRKYKKTKIDLLLHHLLSLFYGLLCISLNYHVKNKSNSFPYKHNTYKHWKIQDSITGKITTPIISSFRDVNTLGDLPPDSVFECILKPLCMLCNLLFLCECSVTSSSSVIPPPAPAFHMWFLPVLCNLQSTFRVIPRGKLPGKAPMLDMTQSPKAWICSLVYLSTTQTSFILF